MPIAHNLKKVTKNLSKSTGQMHIKGRKFKQLNRATLRDQKITAKKAKHQEQKTYDLEVFKLLQKLVMQQPDKIVFSLEDMKEFIELFISRFDEDLQKFEDQRRPGRPILTKHQILQEKKKYDQHLYKTGFKIPDLSDKSTVERLKLWNGTGGGVVIMKLVHISEDMKQLPLKDEEMKE